MVEIIYKINDRKYRTECPISEMDSVKAFLRSKGFVIKGVVYKHI